jgi:hypothetical protein
MAPKLLEMDEVVKMIHTSIIMNRENGQGETLFVAPQILIVLFLIYLFDNIIQLISLRSLWYYGGW